MIHRYHRNAPEERQKGRKAAAFILLLAAIAGAAAGCGFVLQMPPQARSVSAAVYGQDSRSVTSDVYTPGSVQDSSTWRSRYGG